MEKHKSLTLIASITAILTGAWALEHFIPLFKGGFYVGLIELIAEVTTIFFLLKLTRRNSSCTKSISESYFILFFTTLFIADFSYILFYYILGLSSHLWWTSFLTTFLYGLSFLFVSLGYLFSFSNKIQATKHLLIVVLFALISIPIAGRYIIYPYIMSISDAVFSIEQFSHGFVIVTSLLCLNFTFYALLAAKDLYWSLISVGVLSLGFSDWAIRVEILKGHSPSFGFYEFFWAFAVLLCAGSTVLFKNKSELSSHFDLNSLICSYKAGSTAIVLVFIGIVAFSGFGSDTNFVKVISVSCSIALLVATVISHYQTDKVIQFTKFLVELIKSDDSAKTLESPKHRIVPLDVRESFLSIFSEILAEESSKREAKAQFNLAAQVAHDIRSPLAALEMITANLESLPEEKRLLIRGALGRIKDIANGLLTKNRAPYSESEGPSIQLLPPLIDGLVTEKRTQYRDKIGIEITYELSDSGYGIFSKTQPIELKRVLSNLINNSVESIAHTGQVIVSIQGNDSTAIISIEDTGKGIPSNVLPSLMSRGSTHGKADGSGLGLYHAQITIESWGGHLGLESTEERGTKVTIQIPRAPAPQWFVPELTLISGTTVVVLDDDSSIHQIWKQRFDGIKAQLLELKVVHLSTPDLLNQWCQNHSPKNTLFLCDYELIGHSETGLQVIEKLGIQNQSILVTSYYDDEKVRSECKRLGIKLIPKGMAGFIPIEPASLATPIDAVLVDDDSLIHMSWNLEAKQIGKRLKSFLSADEFLGSCSTLDRTTPIYIDSNLGGGIRGEDIAQQAWNLGFKSIYLTTGYQATNFKPMIWIKAVLGKEPPW